MPAGIHAGPAWEKRLPLQWRSYLDCIASRGIRQCCDSSRLLTAHIDDFQCDCRSSWPDLNDRLERRVLLRGQGLHAMQSQSVGARKLCLPLC
jgi:hypothetical protein